MYIITVTTHLFLHRPCRRPLVHWTRWLHFHLFQGSGWVSLWYNNWRNSLCRWCRVSYHVQRMFCGNYSPFPSQI